ncbi:MAG: hypothetical protein AAB880_00600 [Patescibacteria group bacterium]
MIIKRKLRLALQSAATALTFTLATVGSVGATTTIGSNISTDGSLTVATTSTLQGAVTVTTTTNPQLTAKYDANNYWTANASATGIVTFLRYGSGLRTGFTFSDTVGIATSSAQTLLTVDSTNSSNASTTLAVYTNGTGPAAIFIGGKVGVGTSTPYALFSVAALAGSNALIVGSSTAELFKISDNGSASFNGSGWPEADFTIQGDTLTNLVTVDSSADRVGIASSTPWGLLVVEMGTEARSFVVGNNGSSTPSLVVRGVNGDGSVGIATSTPSAMLSVGPGSNATTTIDLDKVCFRSRTDNGQTIYWWIARLGTATNIGIATSTTSCF